jgi:hypothetical protein
VGLKYINLVPDSVLQKKEIQYQIENNLLDNQSYQTLTTEDQNKVKEVLFEMHSQPVSTPQALSAIEFTLFGLAKMLMKMDLDTSNLSESEIAFYNMFKSYVNQHEITLNPNDWYIPYSQMKMEKTLMNREEYKNKKIDITGSF